VDVRRVGGAGQQGRGPLGAAADLDEPGVGVRIEAG